MVSSKKNVNNESSKKENIVNENGGSVSTGSKTLVVYFSATSHTEKLAKKIAENLNADIFEIVPEEEYTSADLDYNDEDSRVVKEYNDESLRDVLAHEFVCKS